MTEERVDPWGQEGMSRSDAQRRYSNLVLYQLRPMLMDRRLDDEGRISALKRIISSADRFRFESGVVAGMGTREEVLDLVKPFFRLDAGTSVELQDWFKRLVRAFGANMDAGD